MQLSIVVPIYNVEQYLRECLDSLYKIDGIDYEVILVNDGSKDGSREIMEEFKQSYPERTVIVDKENGGLSSARNAGMRVAKGEYISFIDSDNTCSFAYEYTCNCSFSSSYCINYFHTAYLREFISIVLGCCAACGCSDPAYTYRFLNN